MRYPFVVAFSITVLIFAVTTASALQEISDPYEILNRYLQASGELERLLVERTSYSEGSLSVGGMEGSLKAWIRKPGQSRIEITLGPLNIIQGDNGEHAWVLDQNGKLQVITNPDDAIVKRRQIKRLKEEYAFAKPGSDTFTVSLEGIEKVEGRDCYVIKIVNKINVDTYTYYINTATFILEKATFIEDVESRDVFYADYRNIEGLLIPFWTKEISHQTGQTQEIRITHYVSNPEVDLTLFEPPQHTTKDYQFVNGDRAENIPFEFIDNHLYIPVTISGKERLFILDTGASMTVLNQEFAEELGLQLEGELKALDAGGSVTISFTTLPPYNVRGIQFQDQKVAVIDMSELIRRLGLDVVGILGFDFLSRFVTKIDFAHELISFYEPKTFQYIGDGHVLAMHINNSLFTVQATLDRTHNGNWLFDLGAGTTSLDGRYALREGYTKKDGVLRMGHGAGNEYQLKVVKCDSIQFAGLTVYEPEINFAYGGTDTTFTADQIGGLGNSLFRNFILYCDYAGERLIVEKGDKFNHPWPLDNSGLQIAWSNNHEVEVLFVSPNTPAEKSGFVKGDLLRSINGIKVGSLNGVTAIRELLRAEPGTTYEFMVNRAGENKKLKLKLAQIL